MLNNKNKNITLLGTIVGASMGILIGSQMTPMNRRKIMKRARKVTEGLKDGLDIW